GGRAAVLGSEQSTVEAADASGVLVRGVSTLVLRCRSQVLNPRQDRIERALDIADVGPDLLQLLAYLLDVRVMPFDSLGQQDDRAEVVPDLFPHSSNPEPQIIKARPHTRLDLLGLSFDGIGLLSEPVDFLAVSVHPLMHP